MTSTIESQRHSFPPRRVVTYALLRSLVTVVVLVWLYYVFPTSGHVDSGALVVLVVGLLVFAGLILWQIRAIVGANYPGLRAIESLAMALPLFLIIFSISYLILDNATSGAFSEPLTKTDSLYFTVTVFATVGFGDIVAKTELTRVVVTIQMILDLVVIGFIARIILGAVKEGIQRRVDSGGPPAPK
jgi:hypothetical protein